MRAPDLAAAYVGGLAHVHTRLSNRFRHVESNLTVENVLDTLANHRLIEAPGAPLGFVSFSEHPSNPGNPKPVFRRGWRAWGLLRNRTPRVHTIHVDYGIEASILGDRTIDFYPPSPGDQLLIASLHRLPDDVKDSPAQITELLIAACHDPFIDVLGHPARSIEGMRAVDWPAIFAAARDTGTAIEINANTYPLYQGRPIPPEFWPDWLGMLAASGAHSYVGSDIHTRRQLHAFIRNWKGIHGPGRNSANNLALLLQALHTAGIDPARVITADAHRFQAWTNIPKDHRKDIRHP